MQPRINGANYDVYYDPKISPYIKNMNQEPFGYPALNYPMVPRKHELIYPQFYETNYFNDNAFYNYDQQNKISYALQIDNNNIDNGKNLHERNKSLIEYALFRDQNNFRKSMSKNQTKSIDFKKSKSFQDVTKNNELKEIEKTPNIIEKPNKINDAKDNNEKAKINSISSSQMTSSAPQTSHPEPEPKKDDKSKPLNIQMFELRDVKHKSYYGETRESVYKVNNGKLNLTCIKKLTSFNYNIIRKQFTEIFPLIEKQKYCGLVKIHAIFEDENSFYICSDIPKGKNLLENLECVKLNETMLIQLVKTILPIIKLGISEKFPIPSICLENLFFDQKGFELYDYGKFLFDKKFFYYQKTLTEIIYFSPSFVTTKSKTESTELYRLGIILYALTTGLLPFKLDWSKGILKSISSIDFQKNNVFEKLNINISQNLKNFIKILLSDDSKLTIDSISHHIWLNEDPNLPSELINENFKATFKSKKNLKSILFLKNFLLDYIIYNQLLKEIIDKLRNAFNLLDFQMNGTIKAEECSEVLINNIPISIITPSEIPIIISSLNPDINGLVDYTQILSTIIAQALKFFEEKFSSLFNGLETDFGVVPKTIFKEILSIGNISNDNNNYLFELYNDLIFEEKIRFIDFIHSLYTNYRIKATKIVL